MRFDSLTSFDIFFIILSSFFPLQLLPIILKPKQSLFFLLKIKRTYVMNYTQLISCCDIFLTKIIDIKIKRGKVDYVAIEKGYIALQYIFQF